MKKVIYSMIIAGLMAVSPTVKANALFVTAARSLAVISILMLADFALDGEHALSGSTLGRGSALGQIGHGIVTNYSEWAKNNQQTLNNLTTAGYNIASASV